MSAWESPTRRKLESLLISALEANLEALTRIDIVLMERPYRRAAFTLAPKRAFMYTRNPFHHLCDNGIWRPDDVRSAQSARWLVGNGGRMLVTVLTPRAAVELSQGIWMLRGLSLVENPDETNYGVVDREADKPLDWWEGLVFALTHFEGVSAWIINLRSGRVAVVDDNSVMCLSHLADDPFPTILQEFFEAEEGDPMRLLVPSGAEIMGRGRT